MAPLLTRAAVLALAAAAAASRASAAEGDAGDRHTWLFAADAGYSAADSPFGSWPEGGLSKLRRAEDSDGAAVDRLLAEYRGRLGTNWRATVVADIVEDGSSGLDLTEAYVTWRPVPTTPNRQQVRLGAFYPPLSLENGEAGWESPFSDSYSAINTWLGEEIRPLGAEWSLRRRLAGANELGAFAGAFYGNDPAGTLLFWRGWAVHDRQTRLNDRLSIPPAPVWGAAGIVGLRPQTVEPFEEIDDRAGAYAGVEWRHGQRALVQLAHYDNRADPYAYRDGQWGWGTSFDHVAVQLEMPAGIGLMAQWLDGATYWIAGALPDGSFAAQAELVDDEIESHFLLLTRRFAERHRLSVRYDAFSIVRDEAPPALVADDGHAVTLAYRLAGPGRLSAGVEWLEIESRRDLWSWFYGAAPSATERAIKVHVAVRLDELRRGR